MVIAKFINEQPPVRFVNLGDGYYYVYICLNPNSVMESYDMTDSDGNVTADEQTYIEYDYNEFKEKISNLQLSDIEENPEKYLSYAPNEIVNQCTLEEYKNLRQEENKNKFSAFLNSQTILFNNREYGVSKEDQDEMALNLTQYQLIRDITADAKLEWHSKKSECTEFSEEDFIRLIALIKDYVYPYYKQMQHIKKLVFECTQKIDVSLIEIKYE